MAEPAYRDDWFPEQTGGGAWPAQGQWTYADYRRLPDDGRRYEVIRGTLFVTGAPDYDHQFVVHKLHRLLGNPVEEHGWGLVLGAPFEVLLPRGITNPVQPDILFFRTGNGPESGDPSFAGVPDLIVEVLSPSTRRRDEGIKLSSYEDAGVPEYWLVDPRPRTVLIYTLVAGRYVELGLFGEEEAVRSLALPDLQLKAGNLFPTLRRR